MIPRLGINIDHVATLRQARGEDYPSVIEAARICCEEGADQITIHLREDRRHIQDTDVEAVRLVTKKYGRPLNLEMGCNQEITEVALATVPEWVCLVPERREEQTTEGGLNLVSEDNLKKVLQTCERLKEGNQGKTKISLFIEANDVTFSKLTQLKGLIDAVEIHTGDYARNFLTGNETRAWTKDFVTYHKLAQEMGIGYHAGHGLTDLSTVPLLELGVFEEYNIGHWVVSQAVFEGLGNVVRRLGQICKNTR